MLKLHNKAGLASIAVLLSAFAGPALADYPEKPITIIVPWAAGGGTDATARTIAKAMEEELGATINVVNRTGGSGVVGHSAIARANPDGYTLGLVTGEINMMHWQGLTDLTYRDYTPIAQINYDYAGVQVATDGPFEDLEDLVQTVGEQPKGTYNASGTGQGGVWHLAFAGFLMDQGMEPDRVTWIPSQGAAPAMTELAAGGIDIVPSSVPEGRSMIESGRAASLGIMAPERLDSFPDVPTIQEAIGSDYQIGEWRGIAGPKGMDPEIVSTLEDALEAAYNSDTYQGFMAKQGFGTEWRNAEDFGQLMEDMDERFGKIVEQVGLAK
ncbi:tripartite tricarboxylate transporter substrate binding protein [Chromohalobacter canadensis]|uniref:Tripartite tricarboxylate transporter substrate binding protein n=1 Tax=Chromohalobacter canadensis TaxID=141389 RepID=A0ABZ0YAQ2_9GAMM|nr:tripartite tricarboxylate transporter substrate binding protein [Chromohalobacter canadensis]MCK0769435.1 tripartite tricarboxylate transporter substrate binding protein [Chromohalobacter canadensis]MCT8468121.1 tripartite tricarboxylate transporter substrate binding protein [Chromohalobacter canadensis]MCT8470169.1 tripartite tricarboxylate transporter substrate binding protein [Chromohalobacter canadensis]MCT8498629.1 tripartite tricarboxylate transporter substrate binding protein [Chromoh